MNSPAIDIGPMLDEGRWTGYQKLVVALTALAITFDGVDIQLLGFAVPLITAEWDIARTAMAPVLASGLVGMIFGAAFGGIIGDRLGRRRALIGSVVVFGAFTATIAFAESLWSLAALRFCVGLGLGGALPNATALASEYVPLRRRALAVTLAIVCVPLGGVLAGLVAADVLESIGWRNYFIIGGVAPIAVGLLLWLTLPESPRYLAGHAHRWGELRRILARLGVAVPANATFVDRAETTAARSSVRQLFTRELRHDTLLLWTAFLSCLLAVYSSFNWVPSLLSGAGLGVGVASRGLTAFNLGGVLVSIGAALLIPYYGSRVTMTSIAIVGVLGAAVLMATPLTPENTLGIVVLLGITGGAINGVQTILYALGAHVYPTIVRATGVGSASAVGRGGAILSAFAGAWSIEYGGGTAFFLMIGIAMSIAAAALFVLHRHVPARRAAEREAVSQGGRS